MKVVIIFIIFPFILSVVVTFGHRSVFPVMFDGESIEKWWKSALVFKVNSRSPSQKVVGNFMSLQRVNMLWQ